MPQSPLKPLNTDTGEIWFSGGSFHVGPMTTRDGFLAAYARQLFEGKNLMVIDHFSSVDTIYLFYSTLLDDTPFRLTLYFNGPVLGRVKMEAAMAMPGSLKSFHDDWLASVFGYPNEKYSCPWGAVTSCDLTASDYRAPEESFISVDFSKSLSTAERYIKAADVYLRNSLRMRELCSELLVKLEPAAAAADKERIEDLRQQCQDAPPPREDIP